MVRLALALLTLCLGGLAHAAGIDVRLPGPSPYPAELGRAFTVELHYRGEAELEYIPLAAWQADFAVDPGYVRREHNDQRLRLRLTARRSGTLTLAPLRLGPASSDAVTVAVIPAREDGEALDPRWQVSTADAWQGQEIVASLALDSRSPELRLQTAEPRWPGFLVRALPPEAEPLVDGRTRHRRVWLLRVLRGGEQSLTVPELRLLHEGVPVRRFHFPLARIQVRAVPDYLPPTVPVGRLAQEHDAEGHHWLLGHGIPAELLQAALDRAGLQHRGIAEQRSAQGTLSRARIDWAAADNDTARLVFFDPQDGRLRQLDITAPPLHPALWLLVPAALSLSWLSWRRRRVGRWLRRLERRRRLRLRLAALYEPHALRAALLTPGQTLNSWLADWQADFHAPAGLDALLQRLDASCYGGRPAERGLGDALRTAIHCSRPRW